MKALNNWVIIQREMICTDRVLGLHTEWTKLTDCIKYDIQPLFFKTRREAQKVCTIINQSRWGGSYPISGIRKYSQLVKGE